MSVPTNVLQNPVIIIIIQQCHKNAPNYQQYLISHYSFNVSYEVFIYYDMTIGSHVLPLNAMTKSFIHCSWYYYDVSWDCFPTVTKEVHFVVHSRYIDCFEPVCSLHSRSLLVHSLCSLSHICKC